MIAKRPVWNQLALFVLGIFLSNAVLAVDEQANALAEVNLTRQQVGLSAVSLNNNLNQAAQAHADYLQTNLNGISHDETPGLPGFTGAAPSARLTAAGYGWSTMNEVISGGVASGQDAVRGLVQAIYHRFGILAPSVAEAGIGIGTAAGKWPNVVIDFGATVSNAVTMPAGWLGTYPVQGQTDVTRDFFSDTEVPDPVPNLNRVGYPVSIHAGANDTLSVSSFSLKPVGGSVLDVRLLANPADTHVPASAAAIVPVLPLAYGTSYQADFSGTRNGQTVSLSWTFTTVAYSTLQIDLPYQRVGTSQVAQIRVSGGNGGSSMTNSSWQYSGSVPPAPKIVEVSPGLFQVTVSAAADVTVTFGDQDGQSQVAKVSFVDPISETSQFSLGWNLVGNPLQTPIVLIERFGRVDAPISGVTSKVVTVWKWLPTLAQWAFYTPTMTAAELASYVTGKGYAVLDRIEAGEGYWVNANAAISQPARTGVPSPSLPHALNAGWSLLSVGGEALTPAAFDKGLSVGALSGQSLCYPNECWQVSGGLASVPSVKTLWTWDNAGAKWRFYAPSLALQGSAALNSYATGKGYVPYDLNETLYLHTGEGFWVNK
jgi:hypothetical protein